MNVQTANTDDVVLGDASLVIGQSSPADLFRSLPRWEQFNGVWGIREADAQSLLLSARQMNLHLHVESERARLDQEGREIQGARGDRPRYGTEQSTAIIAVHGTMTKRGSSMTAGTLDYRRALRDAVRDPDVSAILLHFDSPGGNMAGLEDFALDVQSAKKQKPVWAYCEDLCCSAAYYIASQADKVYANSTAAVGSIGVFCVVPDFSALYEKEGIKLHKFVAGQPFKGAGAMGTELTEAQQTELQRSVDEVNGYFLTAIQRGRGMTAARAKELNTGAVWVGQAAVKEGLIDGIDSLDNVLAELSRSVSSRGNRSAGGSRQSAELPTPAAAGGDDMSVKIEQLKAALPGASKEFLFDCVEQGLTLEQATSQWLAKLNVQNTTLAAELKAKGEDVTKLTAQVAQLEGEIKTLKASDATPPKDGISEGNSKVVGTAGNDWSAVLAEAVKECKGDKRAGFARAVTAHPELHKSYLAERQGQLPAKKN